MSERATPATDSANATIIPVRSLPAAQWTSAAPDVPAMSSRAPTIESGRCSR